MGRRVGERDESGVNRRMARRAAAREVLFLGLSAAGAWLFINHELLYLEAPYRPSSAPLGAYSLATAVIYLFLRGALIIARGPEGKDSSGRREVSTVPRGTQSAAATVRPRPRASVPSAPSVPPAVAFRKAVLSARSIDPRPPDPLAEDSLGLEADAVASGNRVLKEPWRPSWMALDSRQR